MKLRYFAWVRTRIGVAAEEVEPPPEVATVADLIDWLCLRGEHYRATFERREVLRVAVNHVFVRVDHPVAADDEVALFPPVTGG